MKEFPTRQWMVKRKMTAVRHALQHQLHQEPFLSFIPSLSCEVFPMCVGTDESKRTKTMTENVEKYIQNPLPRLGFYEIKTSKSGKERIVLNQEARGLIDRQWSNFWQEHGNEGVETVLKLESQEYTETLPVQIQESARKSFNSKLRRELKNRFVEDLRGDDDDYHNAVLTKLLSETSDYFGISESKAAGQLYNLHQRIQDNAIELVPDETVREEHVRQAEGLLAEGLLRLMGRHKRNSVGFRNLEEAAEFVSAEKTLNSDNPIREMGKPNLVIEPADIGSVVVTGTPANEVTDEETTPTKRPEPILLLPAYTETRPPIESPVKEVTQTIEEDDTLKAAATGAVVGAGVAAAAGIAATGARTEGDLQPQSEAQTDEIIELASETTSVEAQPPIETIDVTASEPEKSYKHGGIKAAIAGAVAGAGAVLAGVMAGRKKTSEEQQTEENVSGNEPVQTIETKKTVKERWYGYWDGSKRWVEKKWPYLALGASACCLLSVCYLGFQGIRQARSGEWQWETQTAEAAPVNMPTETLFPDEATAQALRKTEIARTTPIIEASSTPTPFSPVTSTPIEKSTATIIPTSTTTNTETAALTPTFTETPTPTETPTVMQERLEDRNRMDYKMGAIDLREPFTVDFPSLNKNIYIIPGVNSSQTGPSDNIKNHMGNWRTEPNFAAVYNTDKPDGQYAVLCHGFADLPCDWLGDKDLPGLQGTITQVINGQIVTEKVVVVDQKAITLDQFVEANVQGYGSEDPAFIVTSSFGAPQTNGLVLMECIGEKIVGPQYENNPNSFDFSGRNVVTLEIVEPVPEDSTEVIPAEDTFDFQIAEAEYNVNGFAGWSKENMSTAAEMVNQYFLTHPISKEHPEFSYLNAVRYFKDDEWINKGKGACDMATLIRRALYAYLKEVGARPSETINPPGVKTQLNSDILTVDWYKHPQLYNTAEPHDLVLITYYTHQNNTDMTVKINEDVLDNLPDDWKVWVEILPEENGAFTAITHSSYK